MPICYLCGAFFPEFRDRRTGLCFCEACIEGLESCGPNILRLFSMTSEATGCVRSTTPPNSQKLEVTQPVEFAQ